MNKWLIRSEPDSVFSLTAHRGIAKGGPRVPVNLLRNENVIIMHLSMLSRVEGATPRKLIYKAIPWVRILNIHGTPII